MTRFASRFTIFTNFSIQDFKTHLEKRKKKVHSGLSQNGMIYFATDVFHKLKATRELGT